MDNTGFLQINVTNNLNVPIQNAVINLSYDGRPEEVIKTLNTNSSGQTDNVELEAPPVILSRTEDNIVMPYAEYSIYVSAEGFEPVDVSGIEILSETSSVQEVKMTSATEVGTGSEID